MVSTDAFILVGSIILLVVVFPVGFYYVFISERGRRSSQHYAVVPDHLIRHATIDFLREMANEKPIRFTPQQLAGFTRNYSARLGADGFGTVYRGVLPNGLAVAVKVSEEQFMAEVGTIGRTHHINLVRLFGFCFDPAVRALVYEYKDNDALDAYLFDRAGADVSVATVAAVAAGIATGLRYLHEECQQKIVHYDIKPGNVLLDGGLTPKVSDFGLARLVNRADTHVSLSGVRGTPGQGSGNRAKKNSGGVRYGRYGRYFPKK